MNVDLTPDQRALVKRTIETGRFTHEEQAVLTEDSMKALAEDVKQRGRTRLAAERNASR